MLISVNRKDKAEVVEVAKLFHENNFRIIATEGTCQLINEAGIPAEKVKKLCEGRPNVLDEITNGKVDIIVNSPVGKDSVYDDSYLRKAAIKGRIPYCTTMAAAMAAARMQVKEKLEKMQQSEGKTEAEVTPQAQRTKKKTIRNVHKKKR